MSGALIAIPVVQLLNKFISFIFLKRNQIILNRELQPFFSKDDVLRATRYYVNPRYQNVSPTVDDEIGIGYISAVKQDLIPLFLDEVFRKDMLKEKYFLVLADSGMGKTSFLINLYIRYKNRRGILLGTSKFETFNYQIVLLPLGYSDVLDEVKNVKDKKNTILLLDAFDEDINAIDRHDDRINEILKEVQQFRFIIITCRTQFFPSRTEEPELTKYMTFGDSNKQYKFQKLYLSVFSDDDIRRYLSLRYSVFSWRYKKSKQIAKKCPSLMVRPLLLSYIDELISSKQIFQYTFQIYEVLIQKWVSRESRKPGITEKYKSHKKYEVLLLNFSEELSVYLYENRAEKRGYYIAKDERMPNFNGIQIRDFDEDYALSDMEKRSKSLLTRDSEGRYKFSHKSIFEFFLAKRILYDGEFGKRFSFDGMEMSSRFINELQTYFLLKFIDDNILSFYVDKMNLDFFSLSSNKRLSVRFSSELFYKFPVGVLRQFYLLDEVNLDISDLPIKFDGNLLKIKNYLGIFEQYYYSNNLSNHTPFDVIQDAGRKFISNSFFKSGVSEPSLENPMFVDDRLFKVEFLKRHGVAIADDQIDNILKINEYLSSNHGDYSLDALVQNYRLFNKNIARYEPGYTNTIISIREKISWEDLKYISIIMLLKEFGADRVNSELALLKQIDRLMCQISLVTGRKISFTLTFGDGKRLLLPRSVFLNVTHPA